MCIGQTNLPPYSATACASFHIHSHPLAGRLFNTELLSSASEFRLFTISPSKLRRYLFGKWGSSGNQCTVTKFEFAMTFVVVNNTGIIQLVVPNWAIIWIRWGKEKPVIFQETTYQYFVWRPPKKPSFLDNNIPWKVSATCFLHKLFGAGQRVDHCVRSSGDTHYPVSGVFQVIVSTFHIYKQK